MDFFMRRGGSEAATSSNTTAASTAAAANYPVIHIESLVPLEVPSAQQAIIDDPTATAEAKLEAALIAIAHIKAIGHDRTSLLEQSQQALATFAKESASLAQQLNDATASLAKAKRDHQRELDELEDKYGDEDERERYLKDLEKELKQWRKLGSQGNQMMIQPVQSVNLGSANEAVGGGGSASPSVAEGGGDGAASRTTGVGKDDGAATDAGADGKGANTAEIASSAGLRSLGQGGATGLSDDEAERFRSRAVSAETALAHAKQSWASTEATLRASVADLTKDLAHANTTIEQHKRTIADLEQRCMALDTESGFRDDNLTSLYEECRELREAAITAENMVRAAEGRIAKEREHASAVEATLSEVQGELEAEQSRHQNTQRQLVGVQKEVQLKADAITTLKLEMTRVVAAAATSGGKRGGAKGGGGAKGAAAGEGATTAASLTEMEEGMGGDGAGGLLAGSSTTNYLGPDGRPKAFTADGNVIHVDLNALYAKVASAESWQRAWQKLKDRQHAVNSLNRTQRMAVGAIVVFALWIVYVLLSAIILVDTSGEDEANNVSRRLQVCEAMLENLRSVQARMATTVAAAVAATGGDVGNGAFTTAAPIA